MHDGIRLLELSERMIADAGRGTQHIDCLPELRKVNLEEWADRVRWRCDIGIENAIAVIYEFFDNGAASFAAAACDNNILHD
jgi:hypothetical protein